MSSPLLGTPLCSTPSTGPISSLILIPPRYLEKQAPSFVTLNIRHPPKHILNFVCTGYELSPSLGWELHKGTGHLFTFLCISFSEPGACTWKALDNCVLTDCLTSYHLCTSVILGSPLMSPVICQVLSLHLHSTFWACALLSTHTETSIMHLYLSPELLKESLIGFPAAFLLSSLPPPHNC